MQIPIPIRLCSSYIIPDTGAAFAFLRPESSIQFYFDQPNWLYIYLNSAVSYTCEFSKVLYLLYCYLIPKLNLRFFTVDSLYYPGFLPAASSFFAQFLDVPRAMLCIAYMFTSYIGTDMNKRHKGLSRCLSTHVQWILCQL
jgi:hypothetical protein